MPRRALAASITPCSRSMPLRGQASRQSKLGPPLPIRKAEKRWERVDRLLSLALGKEGSLTRCFLALIPRLCRREATPSCLPDGELAPATAVFILPPLARMKARRNPLSPPRKERGQAMIPGPESEARSPGLGREGRERHPSYEPSVASESHVLSLPRLWRSRRFSRELRSPNCGRIPRASLPRGRQLTSVPTLPLKR